MFADATMKHLHYIFLFMCLALGMSVILQEEQPALRMLTEASADDSVTPVQTGCFISMSTDYFSIIAHRPFFNDENNERKINGILFQENFYNQASAPSKLLKLKIHPSAEQMQRIFSTHLRVEPECQSFFHPQRYPLFLRVLRLRAETYSDLNPPPYLLPTIFRRYAIGVSLVSLLFIHF